MLGPHVNSERLTELMLNMINSLERVMKRDIAQVLVGPITGSTLLPCPLGHELCENGQETFDIPINWVDVWSLVDLTPQSSKQSRSQSELHV